MFCYAMRMLDMSSPRLVVAGWKRREHQHNENRLIHLIQVKIHV